MDMNGCSYIYWMSEDGLVRFSLEDLSKSGDNDSTPWLGESAKLMNDPLLRLHNEIIEFFLFLQASNEEHGTKEAVFSIVQQTIFQAHEGLEVTAPFLPTKMYLRGTELEIFIVGDISVEDFMRVGGWDSARESGRKESEWERWVSVRGTTVILHRVEAEWSEYLKALQESFSYIHEFKFMYFIVTCMSRQRALHLDISSALLSGILSAFYFERRKQRTRTLSQNILKFLEYFGVGLFQQRRINYLGRNRYEVVLQNTQPQCFSFWVTEKINISTPAIRQLFNLFKNRYRILSNYNFVQEYSILSWLVNPSLLPFSYQ